MGADDAPAPGLLEIPPRDSSSDHHHTPGGVSKQSKGEGTVLLTEAHKTEEEEATIRSIPQGNVNQTQGNVGLAMKLFYIVFILHPLLFYSLGD